ncbi:MAG: ribosome small subunit-dependent GTPase A [Gammaproteobacteria bacterium]|nr:MAG: ribosome small subunit-dependent GTPase A [Gammaproteobacteria bacterium]
MALIRQRNLTKQQLRRIKKQNATTDAYDSKQLLDGVVIAHYGKQLEVQITSLPLQMPVKPTIATGEPEPFWQPIQLGDIWRCHTRTNLAMIATGDKVKWIADPNTGLGRIEHIAKRTSLINRPDRYHKLKPVVANTDILVIVFAPIPAAAASLIDRYLVVAHHANIQPLLVLNKSDLLINKDLAHTQHMLNEYQALGYKTVLTSCTKAQGLEHLKQQIQNKLVVFAGQSGVGKSSLINALLPKSSQDVNVISTNSQLGQHTTTTSRLLPFKDNDYLLKYGGIVDTPGIREYGLWHLSPNDIIKGFIELAPLANLCKFRDCQHTPNTKGCAIQQAVINGDVLKRRVDNLITLQQEANTKHY